MHKHSNLLKCMIIAATDGYVIDCIGPYMSDGENNDANITKNILGKIVDFHNWFYPADLFVVDCGFRNSLAYLKGKNFKTQMSSFLAGAQHTTREANSRLVAKIRWVIGSVNKIID